MSAARLRFSLGVRYLNTRKLPDERGARFLESDRTICPHASARWEAMRGFLCTVFPRPGVYAVRSEVDARRSSREPSLCAAQRPMPKRRLPNRSPPQIGQRPGSLLSKEHCSQGASRIILDGRCAWTLFLDLAKNPARCASPTGPWRK
jgi:hypothetical protein